MGWNEFFSRAKSVLTTELFQIGDTPTTLSTLLLVGLIVLATFRGSRTLRRAVEGRLQKKGGSVGTVGAATALIHYAVLGIGLSIAAQTAGIDLTALFAAGAVFAVGLGFAMQTIAQSFVSGIILLVERSIRPGDIIESEGEPVRVVKMGIRSTVVRTRDGEDIILPNSQLVQGSVTNYTMEDSTIRICFDVGVSYRSDMKLVARTLRESAEALEGRTETPPDVFMEEFGDNAVIFRVAVWIDDPWRRAFSRSALAELIWDAFQEHGIVIAFPQLDLHLDRNVEAALAERAA